jgi:hypothetical protein
VKAESNTFAYNLYYSTLPSSFFVTLRGVKSPLGPTRQTRVLNNTIYLSGTRRTEGVSCSAGCSPDILIMYNNILNVAMKPVFADAPFNEGNNLYWADNGNPWVDLQGFLMSPTSRIGDPRFVDLATQNLRLSSASPAINMGALTTVWNGYKVDLDNSPVPSGGIPDAGVYEYATTTTSAALVACDGEFGATCAGEFLCSPDSNACDTPPPCDIGWSYICDTPAPCIVGNEPSCSPPLVACDPTTQACYYTMLPLVSK